MNRFHRFLDSFFPLFAQILLETSLGSANLFKVRLCLILLPLTIGWASWVLTKIISSRKLFFHLSLNQTLHLNNPITHY